MLGNTNSTAYLSAKQYPLDPRNILEDPNFKFYFDLLDHIGEVDIPLRLRKRLTAKKILQVLCNLTNNNVGNELPTRRVVVPLVLLQRCLQAS